MLFIDVSIYSDIHLETKKKSYLNLFYLPDQVFIFIKSPRTIFVKSFKQVSWVGRGLIVSRVK